MNYDRILEQTELIKAQRARDRQGAGAVVGGGYRGKNTNAKVIELTENEKNEAPFVVLPEKMQLVIKEWEKAYPLPVEYYFGGVLAAFSAFIGNGIKIDFKSSDWKEPAILYMALVGPPSIGKTPALKKVLAPVIRREILLHKQYKEDEKVYRDLKQKAKQNKKDEPPEPLQRQFILDDFTTEVVGPMLIANPNGLILTADELMGFMGNMDRYSNSSSKEFWLKVWSNETAKVNRITRGTLFIPQAFVTIVGGIQNGIVKHLADGPNVENGFVARILFVLPEEFKTPVLTDYKPDQEVIQQYYDAANFVIDQVEDNFMNPVMHSDEYVHKLNLLPGKMQMTSEAEKRYLDYFNEVSRQMDQASTAWEKSALGKLRSYCLRFALILRVMDAAFDREEIRKVGEVTEYDLPSINLSVDLDTLDRAIRICSYFEGTMTAIVERVTAREEENIIKDLPKKSQELYKSLPEEFTTKEGVDYAKKNKVAERTFKRFLNNEKLFTCISRGNYRKNIIVDPGTSGTSGTKADNDLQTR